MASRKMTFALPADLAAEFVKRVPSRERSRYVADAPAHKLAERQRQPIRSCDVANRDPEVLTIEREFNSLPDEIRDPWTDGPSR